MWRALTGIDMSLSDEKYIRKGRCAVMSPLWRSRTNRQLTTYDTKPSPGYKDGSHVIFHGIYSFLSRNSAGCFIKGISSHIFFAGRARASMTVEAAVVLPLFLFFFLNLSCAVELLRLHGNLQLALCETGKRLSIYGYAAEAANGKGSSAQPGEGETQESEKADWWEKLAGVAFSYSYIRSELVKYTGETYLEEAPMTYGAKGLQFLESEILGKGDCFEITVTYSVSPWCSVAGFWPFRMANKYYGHLWNGYEIPGSLSNGEEDRDTVYITEEGEVYHEDRNCRHLNISVQEVQAKEVGQYRNESGAKYELCEICGRQGAGQKAYITAEGLCYHCKKDCPALKRTVYSVLRISAEGYPACRHCAAGGKYRE